jgi:hypothetical protein
LATLSCCAGKAAVVGFTPTLFSPSVRRCCAALVAENRKPRPVICAGIDPVGTARPQSARPGGQHHRISLARVRIGKWVEALAKLRIEIGVLALIFNPEIPFRAVALASLRVASSFA